MHRQLLYFDRSACRPLVETELPRLADGTISFCGGRASPDADSWNAVYRARGVQSPVELQAAGGRDSVLRSFWRKRRSYPFFAILLEQAQLLGDGAATLEIGCGTAQTSLAVAGVCGTVPYGIDVSEHVIGAARKSYAAQGRDPDLLSVADIGSLPFDDRAFQLVFGKTVFEHFPDPRQAVREIHRVTADGGHVVLDVPNLHNAWWTRASERARGHQHTTNFYAAAELRALFETAGFVDSRMWGDSLMYLTPAILLNEVLRIGGRAMGSGVRSCGGLERPFVIGLAETVANRRWLGWALGWADAVAKGIVRGINHLANASPFVTCGNGVLIGIVARKPAAAADTR